MAENKTQPTDASVDDFLDAATPARRRDDGKALADVFREVTGAEPVMWGPSIVGYGSYRYVSPVESPQSRGDWPKAGFSPRKAQLSIYGLKDLPKGAALLPELGTYTEGAGCVYVRKLDDIDLDVLRRLIAIAWSRGDDPDAMTRGPDALVDPRRRSPRSWLSSPRSRIRRCARRTRGAATITA